MLHRLFPPVSTVSHSFMIIFVHYILAIKVEKKRRDNKQARKENNLTKLKYKIPCSIQTLKNVKSVVQIASNNIMAKTEQHERNANKKEEEIN